MTQNIAFVRTEDAPRMAPPPSQSGIMGWLWQNVFHSMSNFSTIGAAIQSLLMILLTVVVFYLGISAIWSLINFTLIDAVWADPEGIKRGVCTTTLQGGDKAADWFGACWPFVSAKWKLYVYGRYPDPELWRPNLVYLIGAAGIGWLIMDAVPYRRIVGMALLALGVGIGLYSMAWFDELPFERVGSQILMVLGLIFLLIPEGVSRRPVALFMILVFPVIAFLLLTGGNLETDPSTWLIFAVLIALTLGLGFAGQKGLLGEAGLALGGTLFSLGAIIAYFALATFLCTIDLGMPTVETADWGGMLVSLVVAVTGIAVSLPIGVLLALGRRSSLPVIRLLSIVFIEFWRGVPLITVLYMSSNMLPFFLPEGVEFNKLLRALIGVALFSSAYMAEVVRGGLQAIPKGQFEGAMALGLPYWRMMNLIVLPQALTLVIPGIVNTFIGLFKDTTLVLIIGLFDLLGMIQFTFSDSAWSSPVQANTGYLAAALFFFFFCFGMSRYSMVMEKRLRRGHAR
ncbi:MAG: amino acid ABC transporter permease [Neomegalonema sp.]|nr:amino acid ABC transporter permease [Neomegalonema sp.]